MKDKPIRTIRFRTAEYASFDLLGYIKKRWEKALNGNGMEKAKRFIKDYTNGCSNQLDCEPPLYHEWLTPEQAECAAEIARDETIDKACEWFYLQLNNCTMECGDIEKFIKDFRKAMKGSQT